MKIRLNFSPDLCSHEIHVENFSSRTCALAIGSRQNASSDRRARMLAQDIRALRKARGLTLAETALQARPLGRLAEPGRARHVDPVDRAICARFADLFGVPLSLFFSHDVPDEDERGVVVRAGRRRSLGTSDSGLVEELLSPDLGGSFEMLRSVFAPGAALEDEARCGRPRKPAMSFPARSTSRSTASGTGLPKATASASTASRSAGRIRAPSRRWSSGWFRRRSIEGCERVGEEHGRASNHGPRGDHRRRRGRRLLALPSGQGRLDRLRASGKERADLRLDLACRRQRADLLVVLVADEHAALFGRALSRAGEGGRLSR